MDREMSETGKRGEATPSAKPMDKQKMIRKLTDMEMYEEGMTIIEMTGILKMIKESQDMAKPGSHNRIINKTPEPQQQAHQPCYSQAVNANSSGLSQRVSTSPELSPNQRNSILSQEKNGESPEEAMFSTIVKNPFVKDSKEAAANTNKACLSVNENSIEATNENKRVNSRMNSQLRNEQKYPKWKINPLDFVINERDVPLASRFRQSTDQDSADEITSAEIEKGIAEISLQLLKVSEAFRRQRWDANRVGRTNPWGTPIIAGQADMGNGSFDDAAIVEETTEEIDPPDEPNHNIVTETPSGRTRRACVNKLGAHAYDEIEGKNSDDDIETVQKKRKPAKLEDLLEDSNVPQETNLNTTNENSRRRKCPVRDDEYHWGDDIMNDSDEETRNVTKRKKAKPSNTKKATTSRSTRVKSVEPVSTNETNFRSIEKEDQSAICIDDSDEIMIDDSAGNSQSLDNAQRSVSVDATLSTYPRKVVPPNTRSNSQSFNKGQRSVSTEATSSTYPRRIAPPNPKGKFWQIRSRKPLHPNASRVNQQEKQDNEDDAEVARTIARDRGKVGLQENEITEVLENDDEVTEEPSSSVQSNYVSFRPSSRIREQCDFLRIQSQKEEEAELLRQEVQRSKEAKIIQDKQKRVSQRVREAAEKAKSEELNDKRRLAFQENWNANIRAKEKQRQMERTELYPEGPRRSSDVLNVEVMLENRFDMDQMEVEVIRDKRHSDDSQSKHLPCPICSKKFPVEEIEAHAASCEEYDAAGSAGGSRSNSPAIPMATRIPRQRDNSSELYTCDTCSNFRAKNGRDFEDHVQSCLARLKSGVSDETGSVVEVPDSPIRTVRRTSEQTDSAINYRQFMPRVRSNLNTGIKRKR